MMYTEVPSEFNGGGREGRVTVFSTDGAGTRGYAQRIKLDPFHIEK